MALAKKADLQQEIATSNDGRDITRGYSGPLAMPSDRVLRQRGGGDLALYEQVLSDPLCAALFGDRRRAVVAKEWQVDAASDRPADVQAAEFIRAQLQRVGWDRITDKMLFGAWYGFAVAEVLYAIEGSQLVWQAIKVRDRRRFRFTPTGELRMLTLNNMLEGEVLPEDKFWHLSTGADHDDEPYGLGLAHWCYWPVLFKRGGMKFWLNFLEKFASPTAIGRYDPNETAEKQAKLLAALQAISTDSAVIVPKGMDVALLEAARNGGADYKALQDQMDGVIAKIIVGQTASSQGTPGRLGGDDLQADVRIDLVKADADLVCESFSCGPVAWLCKRNFPNAVPPRVYRVTEAAEDRNQRAERDKKVSEMGFKPTLAYVAETYGGEWVESTAAPVLAAPGPADFAAPGVTPSYTDALVEVLMQQAGPVTDSWVAALKKDVEAAADFDDLLGRLAVRLSDLPLDVLGEAIAGASAAAERAGRVDARADRA